MGEWISLNSTNISRVRWDETAMTLDVEFQGGRVYQYYDVPKAVFDGLVHAGDSHGKFFADSIKGHYRYSRL